MTNRPTTLERAFQLARSGEYPTISDIRRQLKQEGFSDAPSQISGPSMLKQLRKLCEAARPEVEAVAEEVEPALDAQ